MRSIVIASLVLTLAGAAAAQPAPPRPAPEPASPPPSAPLAASPSPAPSAAPPSAAAEQPPDPGTALVLSFCGSLAAWSTLLIGAQFDHGRNPAVPLGAVATLFAPSFGRWYAGEPFSRGFRTRLVGAGVMIATAIPALSCEDECSFGGLQYVFYTGIGLYLFGTLDDIFTVPHAARPAQSHRSVALAPMIHRRGSGLMLTAQF